jgi:hypothetical protein
LNILDNERGYELINSNGNYNCSFLVKSVNNIDSHYLFNCRNCTNCCLSSNQQNKSYMFKNRQLSKEEYEKIMQEFFIGNYKIQERFKKEFIELSKNSICRFAMITNSTNCVGDIIRNSKNTDYSFSILDAENSKYIFFSNSITKDCYDLFWTGRNQSCYEITDGGSGSSNIMFSTVVNSSYDVRYSFSLENSKNMFGCVGLKNKQYCILNKQYTKEEYEKLIPKIIKHMDEMPYINKEEIVYKYGEFFPIEFSPFAYNESLAYEECPMTRKEVEKKGYFWRDMEEKQYKTTIESDKLPDSIKDVDDNFLKEIIACPNKGQIETKCTFGYRIMPDELRFYRLMNIPLPRLCPNCRYYERRKWRNPWKLWHRKCMKKDCTNEFETSYAPDRPEIVYCEKCYNQEVY